VAPSSGDRSGERDIVRGPEAWLNWQAERAGQPARSTSSTSGALLVPLWQEYALYSDAELSGDLEIGPYRVMLTLADVPTGVGRAAMQAVVRVREHLGDPLVGEIDWSAEDVEGYYGGDVADELAALLSLALGCRMRSGGVMRQAFDNDPLGAPRERAHRAPALAEPVHAPMLPRVADPASLEDAQGLLVGYSTLAGRQAIAVVRAAQPYADALWWADADPRISWIKLVSAIETAANAWHSLTRPDPVEQLRHLEGRLYAELHDTAPDAIPIVAKRLERQLRATAKFLEFTLAFLPDPPGIRPQGCSLDWSTLRDALQVIYGHRSRDLHDGVPFPAPLCQPPNSDAGGVPCGAIPESCGCV
jgi:hypothetical protein